MSFYLILTRRCVCVYMSAKSSIYINTHPVFLNGRMFLFTLKYKYLGTLITHDGSDDANMSRQRGFFMRAAMFYLRTSEHDRQLGKLCYLELSVAT